MKLTYGSTNGFASSPGCIHKLSRTRCESLWVIWRAMPTATPTCLGKRAEQRLAHALTHLGHHTGRHHSGVVQVDVTNEQLGNLSDVSMFTATRLLKKWERNGAIAKEHNKILILFPEKLDLD